jgi:hypothetical protein
VNEKLPFLESVSHARVDEVIWGHRLRADQSAWALVLEMLNVAQAYLHSADKNPLPDVGRSETPAARQPLRIRFRNLLFNLNQMAAELAADVQAESISSDEAWAKWLKYVEEEYNAPGGADYSQLKERFDDFVQFERALDLVRSTAVTNKDSKKGVYNRYLFPIAAEALYWETTPKGESGTLVFDNTFNTFTRAGTLLHIMLARSKSADHLRTQFAEFLDRDSPGRRLIRQLQVTEPSDSDHYREVPKTYLPYATHRRFDLLAEDYSSILKMKVPDNDKLLWLVPLSALHLAIYHAEIALEECLSGKGPLAMICEMIVRPRTVVRQLSIDSLAQNQDLARRAVESYLKAQFSDPEWTALASSEEDLAIRLDKAASFIGTRFKLTPGKVDEFKSTGQLDSMRDETIRFFRDRHAREFARVHFTYGREAGLVAIRGTNRYRYAPSDHLLQSLVLANVGDEMLLEDFLDLLFQRYGLAIGPRQEKVIALSGQAELAKTVSKTAFRNNQLRLEARLKSMGMLRRLSDSQAYVLNPLQPREQ